ncbi:Na+/H+ antiporter NhaC family protein [Otariodibacter sp.]|uniref:Na+/H+ antiporter NhaC family protein n=1 Tax=Otariodibacter sp. TaxID=3030919 RepID=UPI002628A0A9|nr:Na+/H+ antiporter NhaC family protein [Otariodibacter sp.]
MNLIDYSTSAWSVLPPLLALLLAIFTRRVIISLSIGIIAGALMLNNANVTNSIIYLKNTILSLVYSENRLNSNNINIILFLILLGILTALFSISGSNQAFASWVKNHIKGKREAKLMAASLVFFTFIDDYFHSLAVGAIARPVTDKFKVSRAKLAYILDSTAAPMCVLMPISSWGAYIITLVAGLLATYGITGYSPLGAFMTMSAMNLYAIFSIIMVFLVAYYSLDFGPMRRFEQQALLMTESINLNIDQNTEGKVRNLILPIVVLIIGTVTMMMITGNQALAENKKTFDILGAFENTTVGISLVVGGISSLITASVLIMIDKKINIKEYASIYIIGAKSMSGAILILFFAWTINGIVADIQTGKYLSSLVADTINPIFLPVILFILGSFMAFSTGTSWGTFGIMLPIAAAMATNTDPSLLLPSLSAVMAGAVCGDHCSPISDTTILSSTGAQCNHMVHVTSQLPYALVVATTTAIGYLILGLTKSALLSFITTGSLLAIFIIIVKSKQNKNS